MNLEFYWNASVPAYYICRNSIHTRCPDQAVEKEGEFVIRPKSRGSCIRVSGFVDESNGYLRLTDKECERVRAKDPTHAFREYGES